MTKWGLSATIKAPAREILDFAAYHLEQGAHRLYIYLDDDNPAAFTHLKAHPKIRVVTCDDRYWRKLTGKRPAKHQVRQVINATHAYERRIETDWMAHIDVDEFLRPDEDLSTILGALGDQVNCARVRPMEMLSGDGTAFKAFIPNNHDRRAIVARLYPTYGEHMKIGFISHIVGKLFVRTGLSKLEVRIHNVFQGKETNPGEMELDRVALCHAHATSWQNWLAAYRFRLNNGSYRAELAPNHPREMGGMSMFELLNWIESDSGEAGLQAFYDELCADTPELRARLSAEGLLRLCDLQLDVKRWKHFPEFD